MSGDHLKKLQTSISIGCSNGMQQQSQLLPISPMALNHRYVKLNIGGRLFTTSIDTLSKQDNMLRGRFKLKIFLIEFI